MKKLISLMFTIGMMFGMISCESELPQPQKTPEKVTIPEFKNPLMESGQDSGGGSTTGPPPPVS